MWKLFLAIFAFVPQSLMAAGLVPCGGAGEPICQTCHAAQLINNVSAWLSGIAAILVVILIMYYGLRIVASVGQVSVMESAKRSIKTVLIGYVLILAGWLIIDTIMKAFMSDQVFGVWNEVRCLVPATPTRVST